MLSMDLPTSTKRAWLAEAVPLWKRENNMVRCDDVSAATEQLLSQELDQSLVDVIFKGLTSAETCTVRMLVRALFGLTPACRTRWR